jgi:signal transduction histidine kinase/CheY-like chemotaxis protein
MSHTAPHESTTAAAETQPPANLRFGRVAHASAGRGWALGSIAPLLISIVISVVAVAGIIGLAVHANGTRGNQVKLDGITIDVNQMQNTPWRLVDFNSESNSEVAAQLGGLEHSVGTQLAGLERNASIPELKPLHQLIRANFLVLTTELALLRADRTGQAQALEPRRFATQDRLLAALDRADNTYGSNAVGTEIQATAGSVLIILLLISGFTFFFLRAYAARRSAESLAGELAASRFHLEQAQRLASIGSWEFDFSDQTLICSTEHARLHGWTDSDAPATAETVLAKVAPEDRERVETAFAAVQQLGDELSVDYAVIVGGARRLLHLEAEVVADPAGRPAGLIGTCQDFTERLLRIEAERANQAKSEFMSRMSHELRTPLNAILGFGQLLAGPKLDERQADNLDRIMVAGRHLLDLVNDILDISRVDAGELRLSSEPVNVGTVVSEAIDLMTPMADVRAITLHTEVDDATPWAQADVQRLKQVLLNLLSNAIKYNRDGGRVDVHTCVVADRVQIAVSDNGRGIPPAMREKLFQPFERLGAERTSVEGTGLGLALAKGMIEAMGGTITVQSWPEVGTRFTVELRETAPHGHDAAPTTRLIGDHQGARDQYVLCIEDNPSNLELIEQVLSARPRVELLSALQGTLGIDLARQHHPSLVLLDLHLPDISGGEVLGRLKADPLTRDIPVVVLSADASHGRIERLLDAGAEAYLTKPIEIERLLELVDEALSKPVGSAAA